MVLKVRETLVDRRTRLVNTVRCHVSEYGMITAKGLGTISTLQIANPTGVPPAVLGDMSPRHAIPGGKRTEESYLPPR